MLRSRVGYAAAGCVLAAGLLMSGGAVAVAVPGLGGSSRMAMTVPIIRSRGPQRQAAPSATLLTLCGRRFKASRGRPARPRNQASSLPPARRAHWARAGDQASSLPPATTSPKTQAGGTDAEDQEHAGLVPAHPNPVAAIPSVVAPVTDVVPPVADAVAPVADAVAPVTRCGGAGHRCGRAGYQCAHAGV